MTITMSQLPDSLVVEEILYRVPATSLRRLRSTCKLWNGLFNNKRFAKKHFHKAAKQFMFLMLTREHRIGSLSLQVGLLDPDTSVQFKISHVFHCDGLLLCTREWSHRLVVWNPCTGHTMWLNHSLNNYGGVSITYTLGCYQDNKSDDNRYKILRVVDAEENQIFEIYEIKTDLWRILDVTPDCRLMQTDCSVFLKGKTYWFASYEKELVSFDYTTERFARLSFPNPCGPYGKMSLSVVREEKLSVLLTRIHRLESLEIWVSNPIDEHTVVSWSKILVWDAPRLGVCCETSFLVDEEKKMALCYDRWIRDEDYPNNCFLLYNIVDDNKITLVDSRVSSGGPLHPPRLFNYVPSLVQIM